MALIRVTAKEVQRTAEQLRTLDQNFSNQVNNLVSAEGNLNSMWDCEANDAFHAAFNSDKEYMTQFYNLLNKYCEALDNIAAEYARTEAKAAEIASRRTI